jgi:hypothetical protein
MRDTIPETLGGYSARLYEKICEAEKPLKPDQIFDLI